MAKILRLYILMLRYRVAIMLAIFFLIGASARSGLSEFKTSYLFGILALFFSFIAATSINDISDKDIDKINHPGVKGRPLVTGEATEKDLYLVHISAGILAILFGLLINLEGALIMTSSLIINYIYSAKPFRISYKTHFAPLLLTVAYVLVPFLLGFQASNSNFIWNQDGFFVLSLMLMFGGRLILKDLRDRKGDSLYGKPTFLLKYGKTATCLASLALVFSGNLLLFWSFHEPWLLKLLLEPYFLAIYFLLYRLWLLPEGEMEQSAIAIAAKMGNGVLLSILGIQILNAYYFPSSYYYGFVFSLLVMFFSVFLSLLSNPKYASIGYKG